MTTKDPDESAVSAEIIGSELLYHPWVNKGTAFSEEERAAWKLEGRLPPRVHSQDLQVEQVMEMFRKKTSDLERHIFLMALLDRNERLFYRTLGDNIEEMMPIIYTPTVGEASREYSHTFRRPQGLYICAGHRGRISEVLRNWSAPEVGIIVVTDGERILGLGDLGVNGMGIPIGKLVLYTAAAGIHPSLTLPIALDVGTNNVQLREDPMYLGLAQERLDGKEYDDFLDEFVEAVAEVFPRALLQFEDFANKHAIPLLRRYKNRIRTFNDDMQGTAAVVLAGLYGANRIVGKRLADHKILFLGAGTAGTGIADLIVTAMVKEGLSAVEARRRCWFVDVDGLLVSSRTNLATHNVPYAHEHEPLPDLYSAVTALEPTALIGVSGQPGLFTQSVVEAMARFNRRPIVFPLSNPSSKAECSAEEVYRWTNGTAVVSTGSPFDPVEFQGRTFVPGQGNNAYIFPGLGLGVVASGSRLVTDEMFFVAARTLADQVTEQSLDRGTIYPPLGDIYRVSAAIAAAVARIAYEEGLATVPEPDDLEERINAMRYDPRY